MKTLQTKRLLLRAWQLSDAADLYEYAKKFSSWTWLQVGNLMLALRNHERLSSFL